MQNHCQVLQKKKKKATKKKKSSKRYCPSVGFFIQGHIVYNFKKLGTNTVIVMRVLCTLISFCKTYLLLFLVNEVHYKREYCQLWNNNMGKEKKKKDKKKKFIVFFLFSSDKDRTVQ